MFKIAALCFLFLQLVYAEDAPHIINDCLNPGANATILYDQEVSKAFSFLRTQEETFRIPDNGFSPKPISCITVTNLDNDNDAGYPEIKAGGVGDKYVTIHLKSQFSKGYDFRVIVYYDNATKTEV